MKIALPVSLKNPEAIEWDQSMGANKQSINMLIDLGYVNSALRVGSQCWLIDRHGKRFQLYQDFKHGFVYRWEDIIILDTE